MKDKELFSEWVEQYKDMLWHVCADYSLGRAWEVRDAYQEVLVALWRDMDTIRESRYEKTWVYRVATNTMLMLARKQQNLSVDTLPPDVDQLFQTEAEGPMLIDYANMLRLIDRMNKLDRYIVRSHLDGFSLKEIGEELDMSRNTVTQRYNRAIKKLRQQYEDEF